MSAWDLNRVELLKKLWSDGLSASQIAKQLGGVTRCAVIGKAHRIGLPSRTESMKKATMASVGRSRRTYSAAPRPPARAAAPKPRPALVAPQPPAAARFVAEPAGAATLLSLGPCMCRWPIGDPQSPSFSFCGREADTGSYCPEHNQIAYQPAKPKTSTTVNAAPELSHAQMTRRFAA